MDIHLHAKHPSFLSDFTYFLDTFLKNTQISNFMKISHADMTQPISVFCNGANLLKNAYDLLSTPQTITLESLLKVSQISGNFQQALLNCTQTFPFLNFRRKKFHSKLANKHLHQWTATNFKSNTVRLPEEVLTKTLEIVVSLNFMSQRCGIITNFCIILF
jgi:hypothetical protein